MSGEVLLARTRSLLSATEQDLVPLLEEVHTALAGERPEEAIPIRGVITDGQQSLRKAVARALPEVPHQLCQCQYVREAAKPIFAAHRHAKKERTQPVRGVRPLERALEGRTDGEAEVTRRSGLAVRSALTDDGRPPLAAAGRRRHARRQAVADALARGEQARGEQARGEQARGEQARTAAGKGGCPSR